MNVIIWIHIFSFLKQLLQAVKFIYIFNKDYLIHEGVNSHMASAQVYALTS